jgi:hypothetical protein
MNDLFDLEAGRAARDAALKQVGSNAGDFMGNAMQAIAGLEHGKDYTGEEIRVLLTARDIVPHHVNAWGALINAAIKRGLLRGTGRYVPMTSVKCHAHKSEVYVRT